MSAVLRAKMYVNVVTRHDYGGDNQQEELKLQVVTSGKEGSANSQWSKWTPSGALTLLISNPSAMGKFKPGEHVYVDLIRCDKDSI